MNITLIGSTRFKESFDFWNKTLSLAGHCVYSIACVTTQENSDEPIHPELKLVLDAVHMNKITNSELAFLITANHEDLINGVANIVPYIGESTSREIHFTMMQGKDIWIDRDMVRAGAHLRTGLTNSKEMDVFRGRWVS